ncbi:MAG: hypothetical protein JO002_10890 [Burkholderiaceae bacterium]|nr:hypothetical protein [Burkholderiaceae bacterium]
METLTSTENNTLAAAPFVKLAGEHDREWDAYLHACREVSKNSMLDRREILAFKQARALAYLGKRAQNEGGVYNKTRMRVLTPEFVQLMAKANTAQRYKRYPWLERLLVLLEEIDQVQDQISLKGKVLSIMTLKPAAQVPRN